MVFVVDGCFYSDMCICSPDGVYAYTHHTIHPITSSPPSHHPPHYIIHPITSSTPSHHHPQAVASAFRDIVQQHGGMTADEAAVYVRQLELRGRYKVEAWS